MGMSNADRRRLEWKREWNSVAVAVAVIVVFVVAGTIPSAWANWIDQTGARVILWGLWLLLGYGIVCLLVGLGWTTLRWFRQRQ